MPLSNQPTFRTYLSGKRLSHYTFIHPFLPLKSPRKYSLPQYSLLTHFLQVKINKILKLGKVWIHFLTYLTWFIDKIKNNTYTYSRTANIPEDINSQYGIWEINYLIKIRQKYRQTNISFFLISFSRKAKQTTNKQKVNNERSKHLFHLDNKIF